MKPTWPLIEVGPPAVRAIDDDGTRFVVDQRMRVVTLAGIVPLVTWPGHDG